MFNRWTDDFQVSHAGHLNVCLLSSFFLSLYVLVFKIPLTGDLGFSEVFAKVAEGVSFSGSASGAVLPTGALPLSSSAVALPPSGSAVASLDCTISAIAASTLT